LPVDKGGDAGVLGAHAQFIRRNQAIDDGVNNRGFGRREEEIAAGNDRWNRIFGCQGNTLVTTRALTPLAMMRSAALVSRLRRVTLPTCLDFGVGGCGDLLPGK
jgi:hypothetical protein